MVVGAGKVRWPGLLTISLPQKSQLFRYAWTMDMPTTQPASITALHRRRARYFRAMALTVSTADVAITLVQLAVHYERLATESSLGSASADETDEAQPVATRPRRHRPSNSPG
jgi:hypothetical protein